MHSFENYPHLEIASSQIAFERLLRLPHTSELAPHVPPNDMRCFRDTLATEGVGFGHIYSPTLQMASNPEACELSFAEEAAWYAGSWSAEHRATVEELAEQFSAQTIPSTMVCVAVAAHEEGQRLYHSLSQYVSQSTDPGSFGILLFLNRPMLGEDGRSTDDARTIRALVDFNQNFGAAVNIAVCETIFETPAPIGYVKKLLHDTAILSHLKAGTADPLLILNDADAINLHPDYIAACQEHFDSSPMADVVAGTVDFDHRAYRQSPYVHVAHRLHNIIRILDGKRVAPITHGANTAIRGSAYCAAGGTPLSSTAEDVFLGVALKDLRRGHSTLLGPNDQRLVVETSARRATAAWEAGLAPNETERLIAFGAHNAIVRNRADDEVMGKDGWELEHDPLTFRRRLEYMLTRLMAKNEPHDSSRNWESDIYRAAFGCLGMQYTVGGTQSSPRIVLQNINALREALLAFKHAA